MQEMVRELTLLRAHNLRFQDGDSQATILMFAEAALVCMTMEHFVRVVVGDAAPPDAALFNLLEIAVARKLLRLPWDDQQDGIRRVTAVRNSLLHANYAQAARSSNCASVEDYFQQQFAPELQRMFEITDFIVAQIDPATGRPYAR